MIEGPFEGRLSQENGAGHQEEPALTNAAHSEEAAVIICVNVRLAYCFLKRIRPLSARAMSLGAQYPVLIRERLSVIDLTVDLWHFSSFRLKV